nr:hypothetical protein [Tanacetum cinerariifolium]
GGAAGQAQAAGKEVGAHRAAVHRRIGKKRLQVQRLPEQAAFDAVRFEVLAQGFGRGGSGRVEQDGREPAVGAAAGQLGGRRYG